MFDARSFQQHLATRAIGRYMEYRPVVDTTMRFARRAAEEGAPHGTVVLAEEQTAGRGRQGRSFFSPPGDNLYFTMLLRGAGTRLGALPLAVPLAVCRAARAQGVDAGIKWPNDVLGNGLKLSGMLIDVEGSGDHYTAFPGIGINVNTLFDAQSGLQDTATSLRALLGRRVSREPLLAGVCNNLEDALDLPSADLLTAYREYSLVLGRPVTITSRGGARFEATAVDIEPSGALVVRRSDDGRAEVVTAAEVSLRYAGGDALDPSR